MFGARLALQARSAGFVAFQIWLITDISTLSQTYLLLAPIVSTYTAVCSRLIRLSTGAENE